MREQAEELQKWAAETMSGFSHVVLCGMGGSSLAPLVFGDAFGGALHVLDTTDPDAVLAVPTENSLFVIASKSGSTLEPEIMEEHFWGLTGGDGRALRRDQPTPARSWPPGRRSAASGTRS